MAYISQKCVTCKDRTKRCAGTYSGKDEDGVQFSGQMYLCSNQSCEINIERMRGQKQLRAMASEK